MARFVSVFGVLGLIFGLLVAASAPARAEFFGCNSKYERGKLLYSYSGTPAGYASRYSRHTRASGWAPHQQVSHSRAFYGSGRYWSDRSR